MSFVLVAIYHRSKEKASMWNQEGKTLPPEAPSADKASRLSPDERNVHRAPSAHKARQRGGYRTERQIIDNWLVSIIAN